MVKPVWRALAAAGSMLLLLALAWWAQAGALHAGFVSDDDPIILAFALAHPGADYFYDPAVWRDLSSANFTPWLPFEFALDDRLFGREATGFAAHLLLELGLCALLLQALLKRVVPAAWAFLGAALFVLSVPAAAVGHQLMSRHYAAGLMFSLVALLLAWPRPGQRLTTPRFLAALGAYVLALACKEVFALLPLLLWRQPGARRGGLLPSAVTWGLGVGGLLPYLLWRRWMLGEWVGGYGAVGGAGGAFQPLSAARHLLQTPWHLLGADAWAVAGLALALACTVILLVRHPRRAVTLAAALAVVLLPLVPVAAGVPDTPRYQFVGMALLAAGLVVPPALALRDWPLAQVGAWLLVMMLALRLGLDTQAWDRTQMTRATVVRALDRPLWTAGPNLLLWLPDDLPSQHVQGIEAVRRLTGGGASPSFLYDEIQFEPDFSGRLLWRFDAARGAYADVTAVLPQLLARWRVRRREAPLQADFTYAGATRFLGWRLGPYTQGTYALVSVGGSRVVLAPTGRARVQVTHPQFYIKYTAPEGWMTYSDRLTLPPEGALHWARGESRPPGL